MCDGTVKRLEEGVARESLFTFIKIRIYNSRFLLVRKNALSGSHEIEDLHICLCHI